MSFSAGLLKSFPAMLRRNDGPPSPPGWRRLLPLLLQRRMASPRGNISVQSLRAVPCRPPAPIWSPYRQAPRGDRTPPPPPPRRACPSIKHPLAGFFGLLPSTSLPRTSGGRRRAHTAAAAAVILLPTHLLLCGGWCWIDVLWRDATVSSQRGRVRVGSLLRCLGVQVRWVDEFFMRRCTVIRPFVLFRLPLQVFRNRSFGFTRGSVERVHRPFRKTGGQSSND
mmetsp:Transcript_6877/g.19285  ORF Transcript_6877/g.19285 Transcript_6877/m.19285 type:complete len:224 (-) Transcript_6877:415-1086(-)